MRNKKPTTTSYTRTQPDLVYGSHTVTKLINQVMKDGKKSVAARQIYQAMQLIAEKTKIDALQYLEEALNNIKPELEIRSRRVGGANYQVPMPVRPERKESLAIRWAVDAASARPNKTFRTFGEKLAAELIDAHENQGGAVKKRLDTQKMAEANKAFAHFRW